MQQLRTNDSTCNAPSPYSSERNRNLDCLVEWLSAVVCSWNIIIKGFRNAFVCRVVNRWMCLVCTGPFIMDVRMLEQRSQTSCRSLNRYLLSGTTVSSKIGMLSVVVGFERFGTYGSSSLQRVTFLFRRARASNVHSHLSRIIFSLRRHAVLACLCRLSRLVNNRRNLSQMCLSLRCSIDGVAWLSTWQRRSTKR